MSLLDEHEAVDTPRGPAPVVAQSATAVISPRAGVVAPLPADPGAVLDAAPVWVSAVRSFLPLRAQAGSTRWIRHLPLVAVLLAQVLAGRQMRNTAYQDEALYLYEGHVILDRWTGVHDLDRSPEIYFSGAPQLYPVLAAALDRIGGLEAARALSLLCMLLATAAVYVTAHVLLDRPRQTRVGLLSAAVFATSAPVLFVGRLATFDAISFTAVAVALAVGVVGLHRDSWRLAVASGVLCSLAILLKYAAAVDIPFVLAVMLIGGWSLGRGRAIRHVGLAVATIAAVLGLSLLTWARPLLAGLGFTTTERDVMVAGTPWEMLSDVAGWAGIPVVLMGIGAALLARRRPWLALVLLAGTCAAVGAQVVMGESLSLDKHIVLGLVLGAPLAGCALSQLLRLRAVGVPAVLLGIWAAGLVGADQGERLHTAWPNTTDLVQEVTYSVEAMPWIRMVGDTTEPVRYPLREETEPWQWQDTYENTFTYDGLTGVPAYEEALRDNYFQLAYFDGSSRIGRELEPQMAELGFDLTSDVGRRSGEGSWRIYQRFDDLPVG